VTFVAIFIGLSLRTATTSTEPVMVSPGRTGALKFQFRVQEHRARAGQILGAHGV